MVGLFDEVVPNRRLAYSKEWNSNGEGPGWKWNSQSKIPQNTVYCYCTRDSPNQSRGMLMTTVGASTSKDLNYSWRVRASLACSREITIE